MSDYSDRYTDKKISEVDRALKRTYRTAQTELKKKLADFNKRFNEKSRKKKQQVKDGEITEQEYKDWLTGQVFIRNQWQSQINAVNSVLLDHNKQAIKIINNGTLDVFAESYNFNAFRAESEIVASFTLYNAESVARLILGDPQLLPEWKINEKKDYVWNYDKVNNIVRQAIIQGKNIEEITGELCSRLSTTNENKMRMFARTALGSAQNAGRQKQMEDAAEMGIEVNKQWIAAHDDRTRDSHRALDGEEVPFDKPFSNGLMFPKDPTGAPEEVYNCRCTMKTVYPKYKNEPIYEEPKDFADNAEFYIGGGYDIDDIFTKQDIEYMRHNETEIKSTMFRIEDQRYTYNNVISKLKTGDTFEFTGSYRSFSRSESVIGGMMNELSDEWAGIEKEDIVVFKLIGKKSQFNLSRYGSYMTDQEEGLVGGKFKYISTKQQAIDGQKTTVVEIEQIQTPAQQEKKKTEMVGNQTYEEWKKGKKKRGEVH